MTVGQQDDSVSSFDFCFIEEALFKVARVGIVQFSQGIFCFLTDCSKTLGEDAHPARRVFAIAANSFTVDEDGAVGTQPFGIFWKHEVPAVKDAFIFPVILDFFSVDFLPFFTQVEGVERTGADRVQFFCDDARSAVRVQDAAARFKANTSDQQFMRLDIDVFLGAYIVVAVGALDDPGLPFHLLEPLCKERCVVNVHVNAGLEVLLTQCLNSFHVLFCHNNASLFLQ